MSQSLGSSKANVISTPQGDIEVWEQSRHDGVPLVFLQGFLAGPDVWTDTIQRLAGDCRCITSDSPFGAHRRALNPAADTSPPGIARLVVDVLDRLVIERAVLIGNDSGGVIAQLVAASHPDRTAGLVLLSCDAFEVFPPGHYRHLFRLAAVPGTVVAMARLMSIPAFAASPFGYGAVITRNPLRGLSWVETLRHDRAVRRDLAKLMAGSSKRQTISAARHFAAYDRPVLVAWADNDRLFRRALGERLAAAFPHGRFEPVSDSGTFIPADQPEQLAALIDQFLMEVGP